MKTQTREKSSPRKRNGRLRHRHEANIQIDAMDVNVESGLNWLKAERDHAFVNTVTNFQF
jgi:hypothetical protein